VVRNVCIAVVLLAAACDDGGDDPATDDTGESTSADDATTTNDGGSSSADTSTTAPVVVDYAGELQPLWNTQCTCHLQGASGTMVAPTLTLNEEVSYAELVGTPSMAVPAMSRVTAADLEASYLWHKIGGTHLDVGGTGTQMPPTGPLSPDDIALVQAWIEGGALP
jgi:hypothetical protein